MKTININLLKSLEKKTNHKQNSLSSLSFKEKQTVKLMLAGSCVAFVVSLICFIGVSYLTKNANAELSELKTSKQELNDELSASNLNVKKLKKEKEILELEKISTDIIDKKLVPWHSILTDIAKVVPSDIKIREIIKNEEKQSGTSDIAKGICIAGSVMQQNKNPLHSISYFALNLEETSPYSQLADSNIYNVEFDELLDIYNFKICSKIVNKEKEENINE